MRDEGTAPRRSPASWTVVVPVKSPVHGKSRLDPARDRSDLALAIALDTIAAAAACSRVARVVVVAQDPDALADARAIDGVAVVDDEGARGPDAAVRVGMLHAGDGARAALLGDLPALDPRELDAALACAEDVDRAVVADREGTGSTLVTARAGVPWRSAFGDGSLARHRALGCEPLVLPEDASLRRDVDTPEQLEHAHALGIGTRTAAVLARRVAASAHDA